MICVRDSVCGDSAGFPIRGDINAVPALTVICRSFEKGPVCVCPYSFMNDRLSIIPPNYIERLGVYLPRQRLSANPLRTTEMLKKSEFVVLFFCKWSVPVEATDMRR